MYKSNNTSSTRSNSNNNTRNNSNSKKRAPRYTVPDLTKLAKKIDQFRTGEEYAEFLRKIRQFYHYSPRNMILILMQRPTARHIASYRQWKKLGRTVKKGEKGIAILVPNSYFKLPQTEEEKEDKAADQFARVRSGRLTFRVGYVFDEVQTEGAPIEMGTFAEKAIKIDDSALATQELFNRIASATDFAVKIAPCHVDGECDYTHKVITLDDKLTLTNRVKVLAHEVAHSLFLDHNRYTRPENELVADSVSYAVMHAIGIDSEDSCARYLTTWGANLEKLTEFAPTITKIAHQILAKVDPAPAQTENGDDSDDSDFEPSAPATQEPQQEQQQAPSAPEPVQIEELPGRPQRAQRARKPEPVAAPFVDAPSAPQTAPEQEPQPAPQCAQRARKAQAQKATPAPVPQTAPEQVQITVTAPAEPEPLFFF